MPNPDGTPTQQESLDILEAQLAEIPNNGKAVLNELLGYDFQTRLNDVQEAVDTADSADLIAWNYEIHKLYNDIRPLVKAGALQSGLPKGDLLYVYVTYGKTRGIKQKIQAAKEEIANNYYYSSLPSAPVIIADQIDCGSTPTITDSGHQQISNMLPQCSNVSNDTTSVEAHPLLNLTSLGGDQMNNVHHNCCTKDELQKFQQATDIRFAALETRHDQQLQSMQTTYIQLQQQTQQNTESRMTAMEDCHAVKVKDMEQSQRDMNKRTNQNCDIILLQQRRQQTIEKRMAAMEDKHAREIQAQQDLLQKLSDGTLERLQAMEVEIQAIQSKLPSSTAQITEVSTTSAETHAAGVMQLRKSDDPLNHRINTKNIRTFNGEAEDWEDYEAVLHIELENRCVPKQLYGNYLAELLTGKAFKILSESEEKDRCDFEVLTSKLRSRFGRDAFKKLHKILLATRKQYPGESFRDLATDLAKHSRTVYSQPEASDREANEEFRRAVADDRIRYALDTMQHTSLEEAVAYTQVIHPTFYGISPPGYNYRPGYNQSLSDSSNSTDDSLSVEASHQQLANNQSRSHGRMRRRRGRKPLGPVRWSRDYQPEKSNSIANCHRAVPEIGRAHV
jgi:hypothetical protein